MKYANMDTNHLLRIVKLYVVQDEVNVRESPISRFETCRSFNNLFNLKVSSWSFTVFKGRFATVLVMTVDKHSLHGSG